MGTRRGGGGVAGIVVVRAGLPCRALAGEAAFRNAIHVQGPPCVDIDIMVDVLVVFPNTDYSIRL